MVYMCRVNLWNMGVPRLIRLSSRLNSWNVIENLESRFRERHLLRIELSLLVMWNFDVLLNILPMDIFKNVKENEKKEIGVELYSSNLNFFFNKGARKNLFKH